MTQAEHTPEEWSVKTNQPYCILDASGRELAICAGDYPVSQDRAKHIVACVNALRGLNPKAVQGLVEVLEADLHYHLRWQAYKRMKDALAAVKKEPPMTQADHTPELKPCPWCGAEATIEPNLTGAWGVWLPCECMPAAQGTKQCVAERWNTRHEDKHLRGLNPEAVQAAIEALEKMLHEWRHSGSMATAIQVVIAFLAAVKKEPDVCKKS